jgi:hypothetical protein
MIMINDQLRRFAQKRIKSVLRFFEKKNRGFFSKDISDFAQLFSNTPKIVFGKISVYLLIGRKKFLDELSSGKIYKRLKTMFPK